MTSTPRFAADSLSGDGRLVAGRALALTSAPDGFHRGRVQIYDISDPSRPRLAVELDDEASDCQLAADSGTAVAGSGGWWGISSPGRPLPLRRAADGHRLAFDATGRFLLDYDTAAESADIYRATPGEPPRHIARVDGEPAAVSPDGRFALIPRDQGTQVWHLRPGQAPYLALTLDGVTALNLLAEGQLIDSQSGVITVTESTFVELGRLTHILADPAAVACNIVVRDLTTQEWADLIPGLDYQPTCTR